MAYRVLEVILLSAKDLKNVNLITRMAVYAVATISGDPITRQCTAPDPYGGRHPTWNETLRFKVPPTAAEAATGCLHVLLRAERSLGDRDVGEVIVPLAEILAGTGPGDLGPRPPQFASFQVRKVHRTETRGVLYLSYSLGPVVRTDEPVFGHPMPVPPRPPPPLPRPHPQPALPPSRKPSGDVAVPSPAKPAVPPSPKPAGHVSVPPSPIPSGHAVPSSAKLAGQVAVPPSPKPAGHVAVPPSPIPSGHAVSSPAKQAGQVAVPPSPKPAGHVAVSPAPKPAMHVAVSPAPKPVMHVAVSPAPKPAMHVVASRERETITATWSSGWGSAPDWPAARSAGCWSAAREGEA